MSSTYGPSVSVSWSSHARPMGPSPHVHCFLPGEIAGTARAVTVSAGQTALVHWVRRDAHAGEPWVATTPEPPEGITGTDELLLTATHLLQYRHPTRSPLPYLDEALRRDPGDARAHTMRGSWHLSRG